MNRVLLATSVLSGSLLAQESPTTPRAAWVKIIQGPTIELATEYLTIIRWTTNNPAGSPVHYGIVHYGISPSRLIETAKSPIRLNPGHSSTVFQSSAYDSMTLRRGRPIISGLILWGLTVSGIA